MTPPKSTSSPLYKIGFESVKGKDDCGVGNLKKTIDMQSTIRGTTIVLRSLIFSMPSTTIIPPSTVIASPKARGDSRHGLHHEITAGKHCAKGHACGEKYAEIYDFAFWYKPFFACDEKQCANKRHKNRRNRHV